jgi:hypothetical protein
MSDTQKWQIGDIVVSLEYGEEGGEDYYMVFVVLGYDDSIPLCEDLACCDTLEKAELVAGLLKAYTNAGRRLPSLQDKIEKN